MFCNESIMQNFEIKFVLKKKKIGCVKFCTVLYILHTLICINTTTNLLQFSYLTSNKDMISRKKQQKFKQKSVMFDLFTFLTH